MEDLFIKYPLTQKSNFEKVFEKLEELGEKKEGV